MPSAYIPQPEQNTPPDQRYLTCGIQCSVEFIINKVYKNIRQVNDNQYTEAYNRFMSWKKSPNEIAVFTWYAYADVIIPRKYNTVFLIENPDNYVVSEFTITQCVFEGRLPVHEMAHGCKHLCILEFENGIPDIFKYLPDSVGQKWEILGLCDFENLEGIVSGRKKMLEEMLAERLAFEEEKKLRK